MSGAAGGGAEPARRRLRVTLGRAAMILATAVAMLGIAGRDLRAVTLAAACWLFLMPFFLLFKSSLEAFAFALIWLAMFRFIAPAMSGKAP